MPGHIEATLHNEPKPDEIITNNFPYHTHLPPSIIKFLRDSPIDESGRHMAYLTIEWKEK